jgi:class 3 adenylate cyclase/predicted ATPase
MLFADLKDSTALIEDLDPEEARAIIDPALRLMMDAVRRYGGHIAQSLGDGIFALFGAPVAHEDHPQRALYAALRMQEESRRYAERVRLDTGLNVHVRVGIHTGEVVVRSVRKDDLHTDYVPVGHAVNLAARMEGLATPGSIVVSEQTYKITQGYFTFKPLGAAQVKGFSEPVKIYEALGPGPLRTRLQVAAGRGFARFVGRRGELEQLREALRLAKTGRGQIVGVVGEPGVGKSRLLYEFKPICESDCLVLETVSASHAKTFAYLPLIDLLKGYFELSPRDDERKRREKVTGKVLTLDRSLEDTLPYLFPLLGVTEPDPALQQMDPRVRRERTFAALKRLLVRESLNQPLVLIVEDLHWLDAETQAFLNLFGESIASARVLLLVDYRPEYRHSWGGKTYYTQLRLDPFGEREAEELLTALLAEKVGGQPTASFQPLKRLILAKAQGNPFFIEEIIQELCEQGVLAGTEGESGLNPSPAATSLTDLHIPTTVHAILASRIDRLPPEEKDLLQTLAVVGKEFPVRLLTHVTGRSADTLQTLLSRLRAAEFLYEQPVFPEPTYAFKHALTQEVAYTSLLIERRKALHERTAGAIEELCQQHLEECYGELAYHYTRGGNAEKAVEFLRRAGQQATRRSAYGEAVGHLTTALELLRALPDKSDRAQRELPLQLAFAAALQATKGPAAPEVERAYTRARALCQREQDAPQLFSALRGLWVLHHVRAELTTAREIGEQLLGMAEQLQDPALLLEAHRALGSTLLWQGEFSRARTHLERAGALYDPQLHRSHAFLHGGADPGVSCLCEAARVLWFLGYPDQALRRSQAALDLARKLADPFSFGFALVFAAGLHQLRREGRAAQQRAEEAIALAGAQGFVSLLAAGTIRRGWALAEQGQVEEGLAQMRHGLTARQTTGAELAQPYFLALQAEVYGKVGRVDTALALLAEALAVAHTTGERRLEAELHRLRGELTLQKGARDWRLGAEPSSPQVPSPQHPTPSTHAEAEACFHQAIDIARRQEARSLELRAVTSVARLWRHQGKEAEARQALADVYGWFTEGFDTADLQDARALLRELAR